MAKLQGARGVPQAPKDVSDASTQRALVARVRAGDVSAFETIYRAYRSPLTRLATRIVGTPELGDEVVHEVFLKIWVGRALWDIERSLTAYLFVMTRNAALSVRRRQLRESWWDVPPQHESNEPVEHVDASERPDDVAEARDREAAILRAAHCLPPRIQEAFLLRWRRQLTYAEVAAAMGTSVKTVEKQLGMAFKALRRVLRPWVSDSN